MVAPQLESYYVLLADVIPHRSAYVGKDMVFSPSPRTIGDQVDPLTEEGGKIQQTEVYAWGVKDILELLIFSSQTLTFNEIHITRWRYFIKLTYEKSNLIQQICIVPLL